MKNGKFLKVIKFVSIIYFILILVAIYMDWDFYNNFVENNPDWATLITLIIFFPFLIEAVLYLKNVTEEEKEKEGTTYANYWGIIFGYFMLFVMWAMFLSNRLRH